MKNKFIENPVNNRCLSRRNLVYGVGVNDANYMTSIVTDEGKQITCPFYQKWIDILQRTQSEKYLIRYPTYRGCSICDEWLIFSKFKSWMESQDWIGKCIDKDIIKPGNKVYSPEMCVFVSQHVNLILTNRRRCRGSLPIGVSKYKDKFISEISINKKHVFLGIYKTKEEAAKAYGKVKYNAIMELALIQTDKRVKDGLKLHAIKYLKCEVK